jgi:hypothetical protein
LKDPRVDGRIILKQIFERLDWGDKNWIDLAQDRQVVDSCESSDEPSGSIKCRRFLE